MTGEIESRGIVDRQRFRLDRIEALQKRADEFAEEVVAAAVRQSLADHLRQRLAKVDLPAPAPQPLGRQRHHRQAQQRLQQPVEMGRVEQILAADDIRHALQRVVVNDGQVIARARVLSGDDGIAKHGRNGRDLAGAGIVPCERPSRLRRLLDIEAPGVRARCHALRALVG